MAKKRDMRVNYQKRNAIFFYVDTELEKKLLEIIITSFTMNPSSLLRKILHNEINTVIGKRIKEEDISILYIEVKKK